MMFDNIVLSSRVRLARNIANINFPSKLVDYDDALSVTKGIYALLEEYGDFEFYKMKNLDNIKSLVFLEEHLISKELLDNKDIAALAINYKDDLSVMINEEDHIRQQCVINGFNLQKAFEKISVLDDLILENFKIAYDNNLGFLTASPSNLGTGMRASIMLFLPALTMTGRIDSLISSIEKIGLTVRGAYGEGSKAIGYLYQISNESCLGISEQHIVHNVENVTTKVCEMEEEFRKELLENMGDEMRDLSIRALGILQNCYIISSDEAVKHLSDIKLGMALGIIKNDDSRLIDRLIVYSQPAHLLENYGNNLNAKQRDLFRAKLIREKLKEVSYEL